MARSFLLLALLTAPLAAQDVALDRQATRWRVTLEQVEAPGTYGAPADDLGLLGVHYDVLFEGLPALEAAYVGVGGYAGVSGEEAGFFLVGFTFGALWMPLPAWVVDAGVFLGAGGDAGGPVEDGWGVRPFVALERVFGLYGLRAEASWLDLDQYDGDDLNLALGLTLPAELLRARGARLPRRLPAVAVVPRTTRVTLRTLGLDVGRGALLRDGTPVTADPVLAGVGVDYFVTPQVFVPIEAYGGVGGEADGLVQAGAGLGASLPLFGSRVTFEAKGSALVGGGGGHDTGGGLGWHAQAGLRALVAAGVALEVLGGTQGYLDGELDGETLSVGLSWTGRPLELARNYPRVDLDREGLSDDDARIESLSVEALSKFHLPSEARKKNGSELNNTISLVGVGVAHEVRRNLEVTARAFAAYGGEVGGYSEGLLGLRYGLSPVAGASLSVHGEVGAAGGGQVDVGSGLIYQASAVLGWDLSRSTQLTLAYGKTDANTGPFEAETVTVGLGWRLNRAVAR